MPTKTDQVFAIDREWPDLLDLTPDQIARLTRPDREKRLDYLIRESFNIFRAACDALIVDAGKEYVGTALLFSGGNDSTALAHMFRGHADIAIHANTGIGIEETRRFVRATCDEWRLPLFEVHPPTSYRELVLAHGFPGPGQHFKQFQRLKERGIMRARASIVTRPRHERIVFLAGRRKDESERRSNIPLWEREGSVVWISPFALWTKLDLNTYRVLHGVPRNRVSDLIHMSGECLCGSFAKRNELEELRAWFPGVAAEIEGLEAEVREVAASRGIPAERTRWGWGAHRSSPPRASKHTGALCSSCVAPQ